jgi:hypothetical protein
MLAYRKHPHDPLAAADGSIWYTGQMASTLGRLDPKTGVFKEYHTSIPNSGPHGLVADQIFDVIRRDVAARGFAPVKPCRRPDGRCP